VGGARFATGLLRAMEPEDVAIVANVGDDLDLLGLRICPDVDTLLYTLSGRSDPEQGWGVAGDTREALAVIAELGGPDWFILGDRDIGLHLVRSERLAEGEPLSAIVADVARRMGIAAALVPATDDRLRTRVLTDAGEVDFQTWFVAGRAQARVRGVRFEGAPGAEPAPGVLEVLAAAERVVIAPSNVLISVEPILAVDGIRDALAARRADVVAVTPLIAGEAVKGPLATMLDGLGLERSALGVARRLADVCGTFVLDLEDAELAPAIEALDMRVVLAQSLMLDDAARLDLARAALS
jgi:LPPG:FO 2-phospho-L-lactate transferase